MKTIYTLITFLFVSLQMHAQNGYLLMLRENSAYDGQGVLQGENFNLYTYDEEERLTVDESKNNLVNFEYEENIIRSISYFKPELEAYLSTREDLNDNGYRIRYERRFETNPPTIFIDSILLNEENLVLKKVELYERGETKYVSEEKSYTYNAEGQEMHQETIDFDSESNQISSLTITSEYSNDGLLMRQVTKTQDFELNESYSDTTNFFYSNNVLTQTELRKYSALGFEFCQQDRFTSDSKASYRHVDLTYNFDCTEYQMSSLSEDYINNDNIRGRDSLLYYSYDANGEANFRTTQYYLQDGEFGDEELYINYKAENFQYESQLSTNLDYQFFAKSAITSVEDNVEFKEVQLLPNLAEANQIIQFKTESIDYNNYKLLNISGQVVNHAAVVDKKNTLFSAPEQSGVYFVQLYQDRKLASKAVKLIVR